MEKKKVRDHNNFSLSIYKVHNLFVFHFHTSPLKIERETVRENKKRKGRKKRRRKRELESESINIEVKGSSQVLIFYVVCSLLNLILPKLQTLFFTFTKPSKIEGQRGICVH